MMVVYVGYEAVDGSIEDSECDATEAWDTSARAWYLGIQEVLRREIRLR